MRLAIRVYGEKENVYGLSKKSMADLGVNTNDDHHRPQKPVVVSPPYRRPRRVRPRFCEEESDAH